MIKRPIFFVFMLLMLPLTIIAQSSINLTPVAKSATIGTGTLSFPKSFVISTGDLAEVEVAEAERFAKDFAKVAGSTVEVVSDASDAFITLSSYSGTEEIGAEGYTLDVTAENISISANEAQGFYYAFQSIKKMLPACVMAGVRDSLVTEFSVPVVSIVDAPRFEYRGFMLDVGRHFFTVEEVKRMIDVMSYYKMNRFHWHLTEDQGWRVEIKKYPKLTTVGSIAPNCLVTDMKDGQYWTNRPYGPYFYTQDELREVVAYAKERHIEIIPEIDMPGHFVAALVAYPEFSCDPTANRVIWTTGGVSKDVLNIANPEAVQFCKDVLTEIMDIFPYEQIHIGGDECPTDAWQKNDDCKALMVELGLSNYRELHSHFIKQMSDHVQERGRKISVWNEAISAEGADTDLVKTTDATVYAWYPAASSARQAATMGLKTIYTPFGPYYINRKQSTDPNEPPGAGGGEDNVQRTYNEVPVPSNIDANIAKNYIGVQGTFWTEQVSSAEYMEYLALPRLIAIAESGWSQQSAKDFSDFQKRITKDTLLLNYNNYTYGRHYILNSDGTTGSQVMPLPSTAENKYWYRLVTKATDERANKCIELLGEGSPLITQHSGKSASVGKLWTNAQAAEGDDAYEYQWWSFELDPNGSGYYAIVCKAEPNGSVKPDPSNTALAGRWSYDNNAKHYNFILGDNGYGENGEDYFYSIRSSKVSGYWLNSSKGGQGFAVNPYDKPSDGNGGLWTFIPQVPIPVTNNDLEETVNDFKNVLRVMNTYDGSEKVPGAFAKSAVDSLSNFINDVDFSAMTEEEKVGFAAELEAMQEALYATFGYLEENSTYRFTNANEDFEGIAIAMKGRNANLQHDKGTFINDAWIVTSSTINDDNTQTVQLKNFVTEDAIGTTRAKNDKLGYPVSVGTAANVVFSFDILENEYTISIDDKNLYPVPDESLTLPGIISSGSSINGQNALPQVGGVWNVDKVYVMGIAAVDYKTGEPVGNGKYSRSITAGSSITYEAPEIGNYEFVAWEGHEGTTPTVEAVTGNIDAVALYKRVSSIVTTICRDHRGAIISIKDSICPTGENYTVKYPEHKYYTFASAEVEDGTVITPDKDVTLEAIYTTNAFNGVKEVTNAVTELKAGNSYVIYDTSPSDAARKGFCRADNELNVMKSATPINVDPSHTWILEESGNGFKVKNEKYGMYVPQLIKSAGTKLSANADTYAFTLNADGSTWKIKGTNNLCWDGLATGALVGWNDPGHPFEVYEYIAEPYFEVIVNSITADDTLAIKRTMVKAGESYTLEADNIEDYSIKEITGDTDKLECVEDNLVINVIYQSVSTGIGNIDAENTNNGIYGITGHKLRSITSPGFYIVNGKKVIVTK